MSNHRNKSKAASDKRAQEARGGNFVFAAGAKAIRRSRNIAKKLSGFFGRGSAAAALLAAGAYFGAAGNAEAGVELGGNCSLDSLNFVSVTIGNINKAPDITIPVNMTCNIPAGTAKADIGNPATGNRQVGYCWHVHDQDYHFTYHTVALKPPSYPPNMPYIKYNFYAVSTGLKVACMGPVAAGQYNVLGWATGGGAGAAGYVQYHMSDAMIMRFENNEGVTLSPGHYQYSSLKQPAFHAKMAAVKPDVSTDPHYQANIGPFCHADDNPYDNDILGDTQDSQSPTVDVWVRTYCNMSIKNQAAFPTYASLQNVKPITATLNVDCSAGTHFQIDSNLGLHSVGNQRYMKAQNGNDTIAYNIDSITSLSPNYAPDAADPLRSWKDYGNGTPAGINYDIQLSIPRQPTPPDGTYTDTIVYTLNHIPESGDITNLNNMAGYTVQ